MKWILKNSKFKYHGYTDTTRNFRLHYKNKSHLSISFCLHKFAANNFLLICLNIFSEDHPQGGYILFIRLYHENSTLYFQSLNKHIIISKIIREL